MTERDGAPGPEQPTWRHRYTGGFGFGGDLSFFFSSSFHFSSLMEEAIVGIPTTLFLSACCRGCGET